MTQANDREKQLFEEMQRGNEARQLLEHPYLSGAFKSVRETIHEKWAESPVRDSEGREKLFQMLALLKMVENQIRGHIETGQQAEIVLNDEKQRKRFFRT